MTAPDPLKKLKAELFHRQNHQHVLRLWCAAERAINGEMMRLWVCNCGHIFMEPTHFGIPGDMGVNL